MADISKLELPSGQVYNIKDAQARGDIAALQTAVSGGVSFLGITTTEITDGSSTSSITVGGETLSAINGALVIYGDDEFVYSSFDTKWHRFGPAGTFRALAYKDSASTSYTPAGSVSKPTFTGSSSDVTITATDNESGNYQPKGTVDAPTISVKTAGATTTVKNPTKVTVAKTVVAAAPGSTAPSNNLTYYSVSGETLSLYQLGFTTGDSITTDDVTVKTGDASYEASAPTFTGTKAQLSGTTTAEGSVSQPAFSGTVATITVS